MQRSMAAEKYRLTGWRWVVERLAGHAEQSVKWTDGSGRLSGGVLVTRSRARRRQSSPFDVVHLDLFVVINDVIAVVLLLILTAGGVAPCPSLAAVIPGPTDRPTAAGHDDVWGLWTSVVRPPAAWPPRSKRRVRRATTTHVRASATHMPSRHHPRWRRRRSIMAVLQYVGNGEGCERFGRVAWRLRLGKSLIRISRSTGRQRTVLTDHGRRQSVTQQEWTSLQEMMRMLLQLLLLLVLIHCDSVVEMRCHAWHDFSLQHRPPTHRPIYPRQSCGEWAGDLDVIAWWSDTFLARDGPRGELVQCETERAVVYTFKVHSSADRKCTGHVATAPAACVNDGWPMSNEVVTWRLATDHTQRERTLYDLLIRHVTRSSRWTSGPRKSDVDRVA